MQISLNLRLHGKDYSGSDTDAPARYVSSGRRINDRTFERNDNIYSKTLYIQQIELSPQKTLTMTPSSSGHSRELVPCISLAGVEQFHRIRKGQFALSRLQLKDQTAPAILNAVLAA
jgi:hypothetical protein